MTNEELVAEIQAGINVQANMAELYQQNRGMIVQMALPFTGVCELDDLLQEAYFGLEKAVQGFDPGKGFKFMTYAEHRIRRAFYQYTVNSRNRVISFHTLEQISKYQKFRSDFRAVVGDEPTDQEYCYHLHITPEKLKELRQYMVQDFCISLNDPVPGTDDFTLEETLAADDDLEDAVLEQVAVQEGKELLWGAVSDLGGRYTTVIENEFQRGFTLEQNATQLEISKERVRQLKLKALRLLHGNKKVKQAAECFDYECNQNYHWGVGRFKNSGTSSTEYVALKHIAQEQARKTLTEQADDLSSSIRVIGYRFHEKGKVPVGVRKLEEVNADIDRMIAEYRERLQKKGGADGNATGETQG